MRISDWSSVVCSSDLSDGVSGHIAAGHRHHADPLGAAQGSACRYYRDAAGGGLVTVADQAGCHQGLASMDQWRVVCAVSGNCLIRSEESRVGKECVSTCSTWWSPNQ